MYSLIKQVFIVLLSLSESLATKCLSLDDEPSIVRPTLIDLNPVELKCYLLMSSIDNCTGSCNVLSPEIRVPKDISVKAFNLITNKNETKKWENMFHVIVNANSVVQHVIQIKNGLIKHVNVNVQLS